MTELCWRWIHHTIAPQHGSRWFGTFVAVVILLVTVVSGGAVLVVPTLDVAFFPPSFVVMAVVVTQMATHSLGYITTRLALLRDERLQLLGALPISRRRMAVLAQLAPLLLQVGIGLVSGPALVRILHESGARTYSQATILAVFGAVSGIFLALVGLWCAERITVRNGSASLFAMVPLVSWVLWFAVSGWLARTRSYQSMSWEHTLLLWPVATRAASATDFVVLTGMILTILLLVTPMVGSMRIPSIVDGSLGTLPFCRVPTVVSLVLRGSRNARTRAHIVSGTVLTGGVGLAEWLAVDVPVSGLVAFFAALYSAAIVAQVRTVSGTVMLDWVVGGDPKRTGAAVLAAGSVLSAPVLVCASLMTLLVEGKQAAVVALLLGGIGGAAGLLVVTGLRVLPGNTAGEAVVVAGSLACVAFAVRVASAGSSEPHLALLSVILLVVLLTVIALCRVTDARTWARFRAGSSLRKRSTT